MSSDNRYSENTIIKNGKEYKLEKVWRTKKTDYTRDAKGQLFPFPKHNDHEWAGKQTILNRLKNINEYLEIKNKYKVYSEPENCLLCNKKNVSTKRYELMNFMWEDGLEHYISVHNIEPSVQFKQFILNKKITRRLSDLYRNISRTSQSTSKISKVILNRVRKDDKDYVMIERNQMLILDALMIHGGYIKKYLDVKQNLARYSEHAGFLDFDGESLVKIVVSGKTTRIDDGDSEIFQPMTMEDMLDYEYVFHTHPPTPKPGGRATEGILYEVPSIGDLYHFIDHHNDGNVIGSLVVTAEGLYNIRKASSGMSNIDIDEDDLYNKYQIVFNKIQKKAISMYGTNFSTNKFYSVIAQDTSFIEKMNYVLNLYDIHIDFYPRKRDIKGKWIIDTVFLVFRENKHIQELTDR